MVNITISVTGLNFFSRFRPSIPLAPGISISISTTSGFSFKTSSSIVLQLICSPVNAKPSLPCTSAERLSRNESLSSYIETFINILQMVTDTISLVFVLLLKSSGGP